MKKFVFSMEKILELRRFEQKQAEAELGKANAEVNRIQNELNTVASQRLNVTRVTDGNLDLNIFAQSQNYFIFLDRKKEEFVEELTKAQMVADEKRDIVRQAMQKVKVLEKLKEKKYDEWKKDVLNEEELEMDDVVTSRYNKAE